jgi:hypothetical protein
MFSPTYNWNKTQQRLEAFWDCQLIDRPIIQVTAPLPGKHATPDFSQLSLEQRWTDPDVQMAMLDASLEATYFAGDAFPTWRPNLGPGFLAGVLGAPVEYQPETVWYHPCITDLDKAHLPRFDPAAPHWQILEKLVKTAAERAPGRFILGQCDMIPSTDILAVLMGPEALCMAMIEKPALVTTWLALLTNFFLEACHTQEEWLPANNGYTNWLSTWSAQRSYTLQNDFSCMISPELFGRLCVRELESICGFFPQAAYHLDGPGAIKHLDALLAIPGIKAIQWSQGDGQPPMREWVPMLKRIQRARKGLYLFCEAGEVEILLRELSHAGLILLTTAPTPEAADALVKLAEDMR